MRVEWKVKRLHQKWIRRAQKPPSWRTFCNNTSPTRFCRLRPPVALLGWGCDPNFFFFFGRPLPGLTHFEVSRWLRESIYTKQNCLCVCAMSHLELWEFQNANSTLSASISHTTTVVHFLHIFLDTDTLSTHPERHIFVFGDRPKNGLRSVSYTHLTLPTIYSV